MVTDADRRTLYDALSHQLGEGPAGTLMALLPPVDWNDLARRSDVEALRTELKGDLATLKGDFADLKGEVYEVKGEVYALKGGVAHLAARIDSQVGRIMAANVPVMFGVAGLVLAAAKLA